MHWLGRGVTVEYTFKGRTVRLTNPVKTSAETQKKGCVVLFVVRCVCVQLIVLLPPLPPLSSAFLRFLCFPVHSYQVSRGSLLLEKGATCSINGCNKFGQTPLHVSLASGLTPLALLLLSKGANPNILDAHHNLPLHLACTGWCGEAVPVVAALLHNGKCLPVPTLC